MDSQPKDGNLHERIRKEHEELRELLGGIYHSLTKRSETVEQIAVQLQSLCDHLEEHFAEEEDGGLFDQISDLAPRLTDQSNATRNEHVWLLEKLQSVKHVAQGGDGSDQWWERLATTFHGFGKDLMHHESKEHDLLQSAYVDDIGAAD